VVRVSISTACKMALDGNDRVMVVTVPASRFSINNGIGGTSPAPGIRRTVKYRSRKSDTGPKKNVTLRVPILILQKQKKVVMY